MDSSEPSFDNVEPSFDNIFTSTLTDQKDHYADMAINYLSAIDELKDAANICAHNLKVEKAKQKALKEIEASGLYELQMLKSEASRKDDEIKSLLQHLRQSKLTESRKVAPLSRLNYVDPKDITFRTRFVLDKINNDFQNFQVTSQFENVSERIADIRKLFDMLMTQLNELHSKNQVVARTLDALTSLDVTKNTS